LVDDEDPVAEAVSPVVTILVRYPDTAATTSIAVMCAHLLGEGVDELMN
jgi:hypothetical protein